MAGLVIVGAGLAGGRAARSARAAGWEGEITIVGEEQHLPYTRPPLSKQVLTAEQGPIDEHLLPLESNATWLPGERATALDRERREVFLAGGERVPYRRLVLASGCRPRLWNGPGRDLGGLFAIHTFEEANALRQALAGGPRLAIVGAGFIGCEVASSARALGLDVTLIDLTATPMPALGPLLGRRCGDLHRRHGVALRLGESIVAVHGDGGQVCAVELGGGARVEADAVVVALGAVPRCEWLEDSGLCLDTGVRCDATLTSTVDDDVLAAGDVAVWPHRLAAGASVRVAHWTNAAEQGVLAGRNATRERCDREPFTGIPSFWSDQYGVRIQALGLPGFARRMKVVEESDDGSQAIALGDRDGRLVAAVGFDATRRLGAYRDLLGEPFDLSAFYADAANDQDAPPSGVLPTTRTI